MTKVSIGKQEEKALLSKEQKTFNRLIKKIDQERTLLCEWKRLIPIYQERYINEWLPKMDSISSLREQLIRLLDSVYNNKMFSKTDRSKMEHMICSQSLALITEEDREDLKEVYNKYNPVDFDREEEAEKALMKSTMEKILGVELGDDMDMSSIESMMSHAEEHIQKHIEQESKFHNEGRAQRKKSKKALEKEARQQESEKQLTQSMRDIYLKLVRALHPDGEQNTAASQRKTLLMQRVNVAYKNKELLTLLELQLEIEQIDQDAIKAISDDRLKTYNKILTEQLRNIQDEVRTTAFSVSMQFDGPPILFPKEATFYIDISLRQHDRSIQAMQRDIDSFSDLMNLKKWLKAYSIPRYI